MYQQLFRFLLTGGIATSIQYVILFIGVYLLSQSAALASATGYLIGSLLSYVMNYYFTFVNQNSHAQSIIRFYIMVILGWVINTAVIAALADNMKLNVWLSQVIATLLVLIWNFFISRQWVFRSL